MARAKRTDRTEARRRYRAEQAALAETEPGDEHDCPGAERREVAPPRAPAPERPGIMTAFRGAMRPLDLRGDLKALPMVLTNWGFLAAIGITVGAAAPGSSSPTPTRWPPSRSAPRPRSSSSRSSASSTIPYFLGTMALQPPPAIGAFLIGFTAKRASWLGGLIYGIFVTIVAIVVLQTPAGRLLTGDGAAEAVIVRPRRLVAGRAPPCSPRRRVVPPVPGPREPEPPGRSSRPARRSTKPAR